MVAGDDPATRERVGEYEERVKESVYVYVLERELESEREIMRKGELKRERRINSERKAVG